uniref:Intraflagellar transport protein 46 homolog n=1 Tax=Aotus nancymaae TaxID=37293 RepID=A0A2K5E290_AOTNA
MADNSSDEYEEKNNRVLRDGMPQAPGYRGKDMDPVPPAPASSKCHQTPSYGLERVGWYRESQKHRKEPHMKMMMMMMNYEHLPVSAEIKELFQYISRYTPQLTDLDHKLKPFIPDFIPAVGDIEAVLKVPHTDGKPDNLGLLVLDKSSTKQSDPTNSMQHNITQHMKVKSLEDAKSNPKAIDIWFDSISELYRSKPPATVHYTRPTPDTDMLMQEWFLEFEELLVLVLQVSLPTAQTDCSLAEYIDMICAILDIPVYESQIQSLHLLFSLYSEFKNSQHFKALAEGKKAFTPSSNSTSQTGDVETLIFS